MGGQHYPLVLYARKRKGAVMIKEVLIRTGYERSALELLSTVVNVGEQRTEQVVGVALCAIAYALLHIGEIIARIGQQ